MVMVEAMAILYGLQFAHDMDFHRVILESDSRTVTTKLQETIEDYSTIRSRTWDVKALSRGFEICCFKFMPRGCNSTAHAMAAHGQSVSSDCFWVEGTPLEVCEIVAINR